MKRFLSILLVTLMILSLTAFANDNGVSSPNDEPSTDEIVEVPGDVSGDDSPQTGILPIAAIAGAAALGLGGVGVVAFRKKND